MKKMKLQSLGLNVNDLLTREQLKTILGGSGGSGDAGCYKCCSTSTSQCSICVHIQNPSSAYCASGTELKPCHNSTC